MKAPFDQAPRHHWALRYALLVSLVTSVAAWGDTSTGPAPPWHGTRITAPDQHARTENPRRYAHREYADRIIGELDLRAGDRVVDIGAGDGWWTRRIVDRVGADGIVYAMEIDPAKVDGLRAAFADDARVKPILGRRDSTTLAEDCCDLAFFSQVYHHLPEDGRVDYFHHLATILKPTGRVVVIERYTGIDVGRGEHGTRLSELVRQAEDGGWILLRYELLPKTYHYFTIFAPKGLFPLEPERAHGTKR